MSSIDVVSDSGQISVEAATKLKSCLKGLMGTGNGTVLWGHVSTTSAPDSSSSNKIPFINLAIGIFILVSLLVGAVSNSLFLWVLGVKMKKTVNTLWFSHLIFTYLLFCTFQPFFAVYSLFGFHWVFGVAGCKLIIAMFSLTMFTTVFLLTVISLDRYLFICHPVWSQHNRTVPLARRLVAGVWLSSFTLSTPCLAFQETREANNGRTKCLSNFAFSKDLNEPDAQALRIRIHTAVFVMRFLLAFLFPFLIIISCHCRMGQEMRKKKLVRNGKPFGVLVASVASFFVGWLPYHIYHGSPTHWESFGTVQLALRVTMVVGECFNFCFTSILYLFVGEKFQQVFKTSVLALLKRGFTDISILPVVNTDTNEEAHPTNSISSVEVKISPKNGWPLS